MKAEMGKIMDKIDKITAKVKARKITVEEALEALAKNGYCPNLLNDDNGHWCVTFDGFQNVPVGKKAQDISTTFFIKAKDWKKTIYDALIYALEK